MFYGRRSILHEGRYTRSLMDRANPNVYGIAQSWFFDVGLNLQTIRAIQPLSYRTIYNPTVLQKRHTEPSTVDGTDNREVENVLIGQFIKPPVVESWPYIGNNDIGFPIFVDTVYNWDYYVSWPADVQFILNGIPTTYNNYESYVIEPEIYVKFHRDITSVSHSPTVYTPTVKKKLTTTSVQHTGTVNTPTLKKIYTTTSVQHTATVYTPSVIKKVIPTTVNPSKYVSKVFVFKHVTTTSVSSGTAAVYTPSLASSQITTPIVDTGFNLNTVIDNAGTSSYFNSSGYSLYLAYPSDSGLSETSLILNGWELDSAWGVMQDVILNSYELDSAWGLMQDVTLNNWELNTTYTYASVEATLNNWELDSTWGIALNVTLNSWETDSAYTYAEVVSYLYTWEQGSTWGISLDVVNKPWELDSTWGISLDVTLKSWELDNSYTYAYSQPVTVWELDNTYYVGGLEWGLTQEWGVPDGGLIPDLLILMNQARANVGLPGYKIYSGASPDIANQHCLDMANTGIFAHNSDYFPVGWHSVMERAWHMKEYVTASSETLILAYVWGGDIDAQYIFDSWWDSPLHKAVMLMDWGGANNNNIYVQIGFGFYGFNNDLISQGYDNPEDVRWVTAAYFDLTPYTGSEMNIQFNMYWNVEGACEYIFDAAYNVDCYVYAASSQTAIYAIQVATQHETLSGVLVSAQHESPIYYSVGSSLESSYNYSFNLSSQHDIKWDLVLYNTVESQHSTVYSVNLSSSFETRYSTMKVIYASHASSYSESVKVKSQFENKYSAMVKVSSAMKSEYGMTFPIYAGFEAIYENGGFVRKAYTFTYDASIRINSTLETSYSINKKVSKQHQIGYSDLVLIVKQVESDYAILAFNKVSQSHKAVYSLMNNPVMIPVNGTKVGYTL